MESGVFYKNGCGLKFPFCGGVSAGRGDLSRSGFYKDYPVTFGAIPSQKGNLYRARVTKKIPPVGGVF